MQDYVEKLNLRRLIWIDYLLSL